MAKEDLSNEISDDGEEESDTVGGEDGEEPSDIEWETDSEEVESDTPAPPRAAAVKKAPVSKKERDEVHAKKQRTVSFGAEKPGTSTGKKESNGKKEARSILKKPRVEPEYESPSEPETGYLAGDKGEGYKTDEDSDSSLDEQGTRNRIGNVPLKWYEGYDHIGYDILGQKIMKPKKSALDALLERVDDPEALRTIWDKVEHESHRLSDKDLATLENVMDNKFPNPNYDPYPDTIEYVQFKPGENPFDMDRTKGSFFNSSKAERRTVQKLMKEIRIARKKGKSLKPKKPTDPNAPYLLWDDNIDDTDPSVKRRQRFHIPPTKVTLPSHSESYNPPAEFLPSQEERTRFYQTHPRDRKEDFLPRKFSCLRHVPVYERTIEDRYRRCLDLFDVTRDSHTRRIIKDPDQLLPKLPSPQDLRPYPCKLGFQYKGHHGAVKSLSVDSSGQWLATGCDDCVVRVFEITSGKMMWAYKLARPVTWVEWCPNAALNQLAATSGNGLYIFVPKACATEATNNQTIKFLHAGKVYRAAELQEEAEAEDVVEEETPPDEDDPEKAIHLCDWKDASPSEAGKDLIIKCIHHAPVIQLTFHSKGDYVAVVAPKDHTKKRGVIIHILSKRQSINPFKKMNEPAMAAKFFPTETSLFITMSKRSFRIYDLVEQRLVKKLKGASSMLSCVDVHSGPENRNILAGSHDRSALWYDLDWGARPFRKMRSHSAAVRSVAYHPRPNAYPLFATASDDGQVHVYHGTVFDDLMKNPLIVPLKILKGHKILKYIGVQTCQFHPTLPWLFTGGADGKVYLWVE